MEFLQRFTHLILVVILLLLSSKGGNVQLTSHKLTMDSCNHWHQCNEWKFVENDIQKKESFVRLLTNRINWWPSRSLPMEVCCFLFSETSLTLRTFIVTVIALEVILELKCVKWWHLSFETIIFSSFIQSQNCSQSGKYVPHSFLAFLVRAALTKKFYTSRKNWTFNHHMKTKMKKNRTVLIITYIFFTYDNVLWTRSSRLRSLLLTASGRMFCLPDIHSVHGANKALTIRVTK